MAVLHVDFRRASPPTPAGPTVTGTLTRRTRSKPTRACARPTGKCGTDPSSTRGVLCDRCIHTKIRVFQRANSLWIVLQTQGWARRVKPKTQILQNCRIPEWFGLKENFRISSSSQVLSRWKSKRGSEQNWVLTLLPAARVRFGIVFVFISGISHRVGKTPAFPSGFPKGKSLLWLTELTNMLYALEIHN